MTPGSLQIAAAKDIVPLLVGVGVAQSDEPWFQCESDTRTIAGRATSIEAVKYHRE